MATETTKTAATPVKSAKKGFGKGWIIGLIFVIVLMGAANVLYMKKIKELEAAKKAAADKAAAEKAAAEKTLPPTEKGDLLVGNPPVVSTAATPAAPGKMPTTTTKTVSANMSKAV